MKILISSKQLAHELNKIDFRIENVIGIIEESKGIVLSTERQNIETSCIILTEGMKIIKQYKRRWDWIKKLVNQVDEQPVTLEISEGIINVIFQY